MKPVRIAFPFWHSQGCQVQQKIPGPAKMSSSLLQQIIYHYHDASYHHRTETQSNNYFMKVRRHRKCMEVMNSELSPHTFPVRAVSFSPSAGHHRADNAAAAVRFRSSPKTRHPRAIHFHLRHCFRSSPIWLENRGHGIPGHPAFSGIFILLTPVKKNQLSIWKLAPHFLVYTKTSCQELN